MGEASEAAEWRAASPPVVVHYAASLVQGLVIVTFPALSAVLKANLALSDGEYGAMFLPQLTFAVIGAVGGGGLARRVGLRALLIVALAMYGVSQLVLAAAGVPAAAAYPCLLAATASAGLAVGLHGAPLNSYPLLFFPRKAHSAVVATHMLLGFGFAASPLIAAPFVEAGAWSAYPLILAAVCLALAIAAAASGLPHGDGPRTHGEAHGEAPAAHPVTAPMFWVFVAIALLYAVAEATFANWAVIFLSEAKGLGEATASLALSVFWGAMVAGRLAISALVTRVSPRRVWAVLPALIVAAFLAIPQTSGAAGGIAGFAFAGLACSAYFPLTVAIASEVFRRDVAWVCSMLVAALMVGIGLGSFTIGTLRALLPLDDLYRLSAVYPLLLLALAIPVLRHRRE